MLTYPLLPNTHYTEIINHFATHTTHTHYQQLKRFIDPKDDDKDEKNKKPLYVPCEEIKKRVLSQKRLFTIFTKHHYTNIMEVLKKCGTMNPDYTTETAFIHNRPFYFLCEKMKKKQLCREKGTDPLVRLINRRINTHGIKTLKKWEAKVHSVLDIFFLMLTWYNQYEIDSMPKDQEIKVYEPYETTVRIEQKFDVKDYDTLLVNNYNAAEWAENIFGNKTKTSMTDWLKIDINEQGKVTLEKQEKSNELRIDTATTCHELSVLLGLKLATLCKTRNDTDSEEQKDRLIRWQNEVNACEQYITLLATMNGGKKIHTYGRYDKRSQAHVVDQNIIDILENVVINL